LTDNSGYILRYLFHKKGIKKNLYELCKDFIESCHGSVDIYLYADNYYGSFELANYLNSKNIKFVCTIRTNKNKWLFKYLHKNLKKTKCGKYSCFINKSKKTIIIAWKDNGKKPVNFITNMKLSHFVNVLRKYKGNFNFINKKGNVTKKTVPAVLPFYNKGMGGVDFIGQLLSAPLKSNLRNFSWKRLNFLVQIKFIIINSFIIYRSHHPLTTYENYLNLLKTGCLNYFKEGEELKKKISRENKLKSKRKCYNKNKNKYNLTKRTKREEIEKKKLIKKENENKIQKQKKFAQETQLLKKGNFLFFIKNYLYSFNRQYSKSKQHFKFN
jgi:hypothetical protein